MEPLGVEEPKQQAHVGQISEVFLQMQRNLYAVAETSAFATFAASVLVTGALITQIVF